MKPHSIVLGVLLLAAGAGGGILLDRQYSPFGRDHAAGSPAATGERRVLYWWDPMMPAFKSDKPGKSPMGMDMVPVREGDVPPGEPGVVTVAPGAIERFGVRTAAVERTSIASTVETFGSVTFDESRVSHVHVRTRGWIERLQARVEGETVKAGQVLFEFFSPDLVNAGSEYLRELQRGGAGGFAEGPEIVRRKLLNLGMSEHQIDEIRSKRQIPDRIQVLAPRSGVVEMLGVAEGMFVEPSLTLMSIIDHDQVWIIADVIESQAALVRLRAAVDARVPSQPGRTWTGVVDYVYPRLNADTRTVRVRMRFDNPDLALKHNMFATVRIATPARDNVLAVPTEALIRTGAGDRVVVAIGDGRFKPMPVKTGIAAGGKVEITSGLKEGDRVVASAQFLLDSESSLSAGLARLEAPPATASDAAAPPIWTEATVNRPPTPDRHVNLSHPPIPQIGWPAMTMDFAVDPAVPADALVAGDRRRINLAKNPDGTYRVVAVQPKASAP